MAEMASNLDSDSGNNTNECVDIKITESVDSKCGLTESWNAEDEWTTEMKFELINLVRDQPALWDHNCADNKNRDIKQGSLAHIAYTIGKPGINNLTCLFDLFKNLV